MCKYKYTRIWKVNGYKLIVANSLEEALETYKTWNNHLPTSDREDIIKIEAVGEGIPKSYDVIEKI